MGPFTITASAIDSCTPRLFEKDGLFFLYAATHPQCRLTLKEHNILIRNATDNDLDSIFEAEQLIWPEGQRASEQEFASRLSLFPEGFFIALTDSRVIAACTSGLMHYDPDDLSHCDSWVRITNNGMLNPRIEILDANAIYIVSNGIVPKWRRKGLRERLIQAQIDLMKSMRLSYVATGAMLPGYNAYCREVAEVSAMEYASTLQNGKSIDPTLRKLSQLGLLLPDNRHLIEDYYPSKESRNYGALLVYTNHL